MKCHPKPATREQADLAIIAATVGGIRMRSDPAWTRFSYLTEPVDQATPKIPFDVGLHEVTSIQNRKRALLRLREFLIATHFSEQEVDLFMESRADRMPPVLCGWGWDFGGFLESEIPTFRSLFTKWSNAERVKNTRQKKKNLRKGTEKNLTPENSRSVA